MSSEVSSPLIRICQPVTDRLAQVASDASETDAGVQPCTRADENAFRDMLDAPGIAIDTGSIGLVGPLRWVDRLPRVAERTPDNAPLSGHRWPRHGTDRARDRVLHSHLLRCAEIAATLPHRRPRDIVNEGKGVLVSGVPVWDTPARRRMRATACWCRKRSAVARTSMHRTDIPVTR